MAQQGGMTQATEGPSIGQLTRVGRAGRRDQQVAEHPARPTGGILGQGGGDEQLPARGRDRSGLGDPAVPEILDPGAAQGEQRRQGRGLAEQAERLADGLGGALDIGAEMRGAEADESPSTSARAGRRPPRGGRRCARPGRPSNGRPGTAAGRARASWRPRRRAAARVHARCRRPRGRCCSARKARSRRDQRRGRARSRPGPPPRPSATTPRSPLGRGPSRQRGARPRERAREAPPVARRSPCGAVASALPAPRTDR